MRTLAAAAWLRALVLVDRGLLEHGQLEHSGSKLLSERPTFLQRRDEEGEGVLAFCIHPLQVAQPREQERSWMLPGSASR